MHSLFALIELINLKGENTIFFGLFRHKQIHILHVQSALIQVKNNNNEREDNFNMYKKNITI